MPRDDDDDDDEDEDEEEEDDGPSLEIPKLIELVICHEPLSQLQIAERNATPPVLDEIIDEIAGEWIAEHHAEISAEVEAGTLGPFPPPPEPEEGSPEALAAADAAADAAAKAAAEDAKPPNEKLTGASLAAALRTPEIHCTSTTTVGELKAALNALLGEVLGFDEDDVSGMPRMHLMTGRRVWTDVSQVRAVVQHNGSLTDLQYGQATFVRIISADLRDPPFTNAAEKEEVERLETKRIDAERAAKQERKKRPGRKR